MDKNLKDYFTTGEFAKLCNVKKQTLFHYDAIGILCPEFIGENNYRYYSYTQLEIFNTISMLKELGMPLSEIKKYMDSRGPQAFLKLLRYQFIEVEDKIRELQWLKRYIQKKIEITKEALSIPIGEIIIETCPAEYLITTEYAGADKEKDIAAAVTKHLNFCHSLDIYSAYAIGGMIPTKHISPDTNYIYSHFFTKINQWEYSDCLVKDAGTFAVCCDNHGYDNAEQICIELLKYAKTHNFKAGPYIYEDLLLDEMSANGYDNYTVKFSLPLL